MSAWPPNFEIVADFFAQLEARQAPDPTPRSPAVESLVGALAGKKASEADYHAYLEYSRGPAVVSPS